MAGFQTSTEVDGALALWAASFPGGGPEAGQRVSSEEEEKAQRGLSNLTPVDDAG